jgi:alanine racemase
MQARLKHNLASSAVSRLNWGGRSTRVEIDLDTIAANVQALRARARAPEFLVVVKADGYGHGSIAVGKAALAAGATRLGVYTVDEGVALRRAGITAPILVFGPFTNAEAPLVWEFTLNPTVTNLPSAKALQNTSMGRTLNYHLKVDSGLTRNGVLPKDAVGLMNQIKELSALTPEGIFTHFARSDEADKRATWTQFSHFTDTVRRLEEGGHWFPMKHTAASGAVHDLPETHLDMVRCGISVYGYYPSDEVSHEVPLSPALTYVSAVARIHLAPAGTGVGYGHEFICTRGTPIALVPIGYGDGLPRTFGRGNGTVLINGQRAPVVARVSMDQITVDVSSVGKVELGQEVVIIGRQGDAVQTADDIGNQTGTINYDVLCGIMPRVPRLYVRDGRLVSVIRSAPQAPVPFDDSSQPV